MYKLTCKVCGKEFKNSFKDVKICDECKNRPCVVCGKQFVRPWPYDQKTCSAECRAKLRKDPDNIARKEEKRKATVKAKYGVDNVSKLDEVKKKISNNHRSQEFSDKVRETSLKKYGVEHFRKSKEVLARTRETMKQRYGVDNISRLDSMKKLISDKLKDPEIRKKYVETSMKHYGVPYPLMDPNIKAKMENTVMERYGVPSYVMLPEYRSAQATNQISGINKAFADRLETDLGVEYEFEFRIDRKFYDLHVLGTDILIELDPTYTHSNLPNHWDKNGLSQDYHLKKSELAVSNGYRCIHIFDWDDISKIENLIKPRKHIYARKCSLSKIDLKTSKQFMQNYHIQGDARGSIYAYGLTYDDCLISVMTFGKPRYNKNYQWELLRLCTKPGYSIVGGPSKMIKAFIEDARPESILSYCDRAKFNGSVYEKLGFVLDHVSPPAKIWSKDEKRITDNLLRQRGYDQLFGTNYGKGTSNEQLMIENGWRSVYDCGQSVYTWKSN